MVCCGVLRCVAVYLSLGLLDASKKTFETVLSGECVACVALCVVVCRSVLQCVTGVAVCCSMLQHVVTFCSVLR